MDKTTHKQRYDASWMTSDFDWHLDAAINLVWRLYEDIYSRLDGMVGPAEYEFTGNTLIAIKTSLEAVRTGLDHLSGKVSEYEVEEAKRLLELHRAEELYHQATERLRLSKPFDEGLKKRIDDIARHDDAEAIPLLEKLLAE